jgi:hypothetical protein
MGRCDVQQLTGMGMFVAHRRRHQGWGEVILVRYADAHPVIAHGRLYLRDQDLLFCLDVKVERVAGRGRLTGPSIRSSADTLA